MENEQIYSSKKELLNFLGIRENFLYPDFSSKYDEKQIPKKNGGIRTIKPPNFNLKKIQRKILDTILCRKQHLLCVFGLSKEKTIVHNAKEHQKNIDFDLLALDIEDFFPNIKKQKVAKIFNNLGFNKQNSTILTKLCTVGGALPQGAPTSPCLASMACIKLDKEIYSYSKKRGLIYTRYFDDISISGESISDKFIKDIELKIEKHGFKSNQAKKHLFKPTEEKIINNIVIKKKALSVSDNYKLEIINIFKKIQEDSNTQNQRVFAGKYGFYLHVNKPEAVAFLTKLKEG